jgi:hypothetical protein
MAKTIYKVELSEDTLLVEQHADGRCELWALLTRKNFAHRLMGFANMVEAIRYTKLLASIHDKAVNQ